MNKKNKFLLIFIGLFLAQFFFVSPLGEFPLNDDWVHIEMVQHWVESGELRMNPYTGPWLFFPILYGAVLMKIFGFSFLLFRISTLFLTFLLGTGLFLFLHKKTNQTVLSFLAALTVWLNPLVYNLSFSFMTDVPALALLGVSIVCFSLGQKNNDYRWLFLGSLSAILGFYTRQTNILILAAFGLFVLFDRQLRGPKNIIALGIPVLGWAIAFWFLHKNQLLPNGDESHIISGNIARLKHAFFWFWYVILYLGLFTLPLSASLIESWREKKYWLSGLAGLAIPIILFLLRGELFPYVPNLINDFGLGPLSDVLQGNFIPLYRVRVWVAVSLAAGFGAGILIYLLSVEKVHRQNCWLWLFIGLFLLPILFLSSFDRYFLPFFLSVVIILGGQFKNKKINLISILLIISVAFYSLTQTIFYLNWNRERAEINTAAISIVQTWPQFTAVDGGYEWTGWLGYWEAQKSGNARAAANSPWWIKFLMTNNTAEYVVSASVLPNHTVIIKKFVPGWNPNHYLFLLKRNQ